MTKQKYISPIAIDLGAKNTGVYFAHYQEGSSLDDIEERAGKVYQLDKNSYTLLMAERTAARHQRRGYDRRQMVKRLFKLIWEKHFKLPWDKDVQQTISFLLNRRGFSFLTEEYDTEELRRFPQEAYDKLPDELKEGIKPNNEGECDFAGEINKWTEEGVEAVEEKFDAINSEPKRIRQRQVFIERTKKLKEYCELRKKGEEIKENNKARINLSKLSKWILEEWHQGNVEGLPPIPLDGKVVDDMVAHLNKKDQEAAQTILDSLPDVSEEEKELKKSCWNFKKKIEDFKLDKADFTQPETHLHHLAFALHKTLNELQSGGRHRSKYFKEIGDVLNNESHTHGYLKRFCKRLNNGGDYQPLNVEKLCNLIGHLSNLELKPLRKYFNDRRHKNGDHWDENKLTEKFANWILREWRVNPQKDKLKAKGEQYDYNKLKNKWQNKSGKVVDFWLDTDPNLTIPPYQDNNNRRPPKCQSLILNVGYLDAKYPAWESWTQQLKDKEEAQDHLEDYEDTLKELKSGKSKSYFGNEITGEPKKDSGRRSFKQLEARVLQFILDRVKDDDPFKLNEIYSHAKKYRQPQSTLENKDEAKEKLEKAIGNSALPEKLRTPRNYENEAIFEAGTFLHLVCKYYKQRQRARDGRIFIHPEYRYIKGRGYQNTGRFDDKNHLLTYCNHKPRQKRYQLLDDLAGLLQVSPDKLEEYVEKHVKGQDGTEIDEKIVAWLSGIAALKTKCGDAAKEQKDRRGSLKLDIQSVFGLIYHNHKKQSESPSDKEVEKILKKSKVSDALKLYRFCKRAKELCLNITEGLYDDSDDDSRQQQWEKDLSRNPARAVYFLAQINNLAFKERSGNATTCAVCSADNARRMMQRKTTGDEDGTAAKAARLPAIPTRLIDGAVMRMARIVGGAIAKDKWEKIKAALEQGNEVCVPIITESNQFEFEPSREELVKSQRTKPRKGKVLQRGGDEDRFDKKKERIKEDGSGICPYTGNQIGDKGEIDHIIPRRSEWGTLNDEANLIWASRVGNQHKNNIPLSLADLKPNYKQAQFSDCVQGWTDDKEIENWIIETIGDESGDEFKFGQYRSFINLKPDEQKAFRHALFLQGHSLREKIIGAINNRNRALVNGTQRYFAEVLANDLYKKAKSVGKHKRLSFDYFGISADVGSSKIDIPSVRKKLQENPAHPELQLHKKDNGVQTTYSHLIDAKIAFMIALSEHNRQGSLKVNAKRISPFDDEYIDENREPHDLYGNIKIPVGEFDKSEGKLERHKPKKDFFTHRVLFDSNAGAWHFLKLIEIETSDKPIYLKGFLDLTALKSCLREDDWQDAINKQYGHNDGNGKFSPYGKLLSEKDKKVIDLYKNQFGYQNEKQQWPKVMIENQKLGGNYFTIRLHQIDKTKVAKFLLEHFNTKSDPNNWKDEDCKIFTQLQNLWYFTKRESLIDQQKPNFSYKPDKLKTGGFINPSLLKAWKELNDKWRDFIRKNDETKYLEFLKDHFLDNKQDHPHQRVRKNFSLPVKSTGQGFMLIKRNSWNGEVIHQCQSQKDGDEGVGLYKKYIEQTGKVVDVLTPYFRSEGIVLMRKIKELKGTLQPLDNLQPVDEKEWYRLRVPSDLEAKIESIENRYQSKGDSNYRVRFKQEVSMEDLIGLMFNGYQIDELKVSTGAQQKAKEFFSNSENQFLSAQEAKKKLEDERDSLSQIKNSDLTTEQKENKQFFKKWLECLNSIQPDKRTLCYKRGVGLKIES